MQLKTEVQLNKNVGIIALPEPYSELPEGSTVIVSGFGKSTYQGPVSQVLKKLVTITTSTENCQAHQAGVIQQTNICATRGQGYGTCAVSCDSSLANQNRLFIHCSQV